LNSNVSQQPYLFKIGVSNPIKVIRNAMITLDYGSRWIYDRKSILSEQTLYYKIIMLLIRRL
jgi:hypothetical protein